METFDIYKDISQRTGGDIYIGVVGPVRTGKSTFVANFMESLVLPLLSDANAKRRAVDELPQSADGTAIMTTQPKFVPNEAVPVTIGDRLRANVRLIDCVGYLIDGVAEFEDGKPRMVKTPWSAEEMPFKEAAEFGTAKVVSEHSTIAVVVTNDGTITEFPRANYVPAEERVVKELKQCGKPFILVLNTTHPQAESVAQLAAALEEKYGVKVLPMNVKAMTKQDAETVLKEILDEFPAQNLRIELPDWMRTLEADDWIIADLLTKIRQNASRVHRMKDCEKLFADSVESEFLKKPQINNVDMGQGVVTYSVEAKEGLFYRVLSDCANMEITDDFSLMTFVKQAAVAKTEYEKVKAALDEAMTDGYGVVNPTLKDMVFENPEIVKQGSRYGVRLKANAPSLHIMKIDVSTEVSPIVGTEEQSRSMLQEFETNPKGIWETNMFGKPLSVMAQEGLGSKLTAMPKEAQLKLRKTVGKIVNEKKGGIICILL